MNVSARLTDWEEMAILKPRPSAGIMVDWQMKLSTELTNWAGSLSSSLLDTTVTLSVQTAALFPCRQTRKYHQNDQLLWLRSMFPRSFVIISSHVASGLHVRKMGFVLTSSINLSRQDMKNVRCVAAGIFNDFTGPTEETFRCYTS